MPSPAPAASYAVVPSNINPNPKGPKHPKFPKDPCKYVVDTWDLKGLPYIYFSFYVCTRRILGHWTLWEYRVFRVSILGIVAMDSDRYFTFGHCIS